MNYIFTFDRNKALTILSHHVDFRAESSTTYRNVSDDMIYRLVIVDSKQKVAGIPTNAKIRTIAMSGRPYGMKRDEYNEIINFLKSRFQNINL